MRVGLRSATVGIVTPLAAAAVALGTTTPAVAVAPDCAEVKCTALLIGGTGTGILTQQQMMTALNGYFANNDEYTRTNVPYPGTFDYLPSVALGAISLNYTLDQTDGPKVVGAFSQGTVVADLVLSQLAFAPEAPDPKDLTFLLVSDPSRSPSAAAWFKPESQYDIIVVTVEYDGVADGPDRWWNGFATSNAYVGALLLHFNSTDVNLADVPKENITVTTNSRGATTTHYLVPTETLPLVQIFPFLAPIEPWLKEQVDKGYTRNDPPEATESDVSLLSLAAAPEGEVTAAQDGDADQDGDTDQNGQADQGNASTTANTQAPQEKRAAAREETPVQAEEETADTATELDNASGMAVAPTDEKVDDTSDDATAQADDQTAGKKVAKDTTGSRPSHRLKPGDNTGSTVGEIKRRLAAENAEKTSSTESANGTAENSGSEASSGKSNTSGNES